MFCFLRVAARESPCGEFATKLFSVTRLDLLRRDICELDDLEQVDLCARSVGLARNLLHEVLKFLSGHRVGVVAKVNQAGHCRV